MNPTTIARIKKLLSLAHCPGATPAEAASAIQKATALAEKEGLSLGDISPDDTTATSGITHEFTKSPIGNFQDFACNLICRQIGASSVHIKGGSRRGYIFVGLPHQVAIATQAFRFLLDTMEASWKRRPDKSIKDRTLYSYGFCEGVEKNLAAIIQRPGLIIACDDYIKHTLPGKLGATYSEKKTKTKFRNLDKRAYSQGIADGSAANCTGAIPRVASPRQSSTVPSNFL